MAVDSLDHLIASSDAIVLGSYDASHVNGVIVVTIQATKVIKGPLSTNSSIAVTWRKDAFPALPVYAGLPRLEQGFGMFFLASGPQGYSIVPVMIGDAEWPDVFIHASALGKDKPPPVSGASSNILGSVLGDLYCSLDLASQFLSI